MADDKAGRDKQADDAERRQRERELDEARERADEVEPARDDPEGRRGDPGAGLGDLDDHEYPTTTGELREAYGDRVIESEDGPRTVDDVLAPVGDESFDSADEVRARIRSRMNRG